MTDEEKAWYLQNSHDSGNKCLDFVSDSYSCIEELHGPKLGSIL